MIRYYSEGVTIPSIKRRVVNTWIKSVAIDVFCKKIGKICYIFCSDEKILEINREYLKHDYYTDIITFDYSEEDTISGDMFISLETVESNAEKFATSVTEELHRTIIHGILHLCGINDKAPGEREIMEKYENQALSLLPKEILNKD